MAVNLTEGGAGVGPSAKSQAAVTPTDTESEAGRPCFVGSTAACDLALGAHPECIRRPLAMTTRRRPASMEEPAREERSADGHADRCPDRSLLGHQPAQ